jgi:tetratricopeptide (TPR) repeat protein
VAAGTTQSEEYLDACCATWARHGRFICEEGLETWPDGTVTARYSFLHALYHDVLYRRVAVGPRVRLHRRIGLRLEAGYGNHAPTLATTLARHFTCAQDLPRAVRYYRYAAETAMQRAAYREAVTCLEQALRALRQLPASRWTMEQGIDLRFDLRNALLELGDHTPIVAHLRRAEHLAQVLGDQRRLGWALAYMTRQLGPVESFDRTIGLGERALAIAGDVGDISLQVVTQCLLGQAYHFLGEYRQAVDVLMRNVMSLTGARRYERFGLPYPASLHTRNWLVASQAELGGFAEGIACGEEAVQIAEGLPQPVHFAHTSFSTGFLYLRKGDLHKAIPALERGVELAQVLNMRVHWYITAACLGYAYVLSGRVAEAVPLLEQAVDSHLYQSWNALCEVYLSEAYFLAGRREEAMQLAERTLVHAAEQKLRGKQAWTLRLLGVLHARSQPQVGELAAAHYCQALALAEELGMRPLVAHCHHGLGTLYATTDQREQARATLAIASAMYQSMDMTFWIPETEAVLAQVDA